MRPNISVTLEPGLERGVPWGRDLYTFVTSAAGHMMRTLQKPRKNRPSKRQVNHRRFLHNMIQRKFADIEAANHRLASTLYFKEEDKNLSSPSPQKPEPPEQLGGPDLEGFLSDPGESRDVDGVSESDALAGSRENDDGGEKKQQGSRTLWKRRSQHSTCASRKQSRGKQEEERGNNKLVDYSPVSSFRGLDGYHGEEFPNGECDYNANLNHLKEPLHDLASAHNAAVSPSFTPELSPLSLNSCDFAIQMFAENSACSQKADIRIENPWTDIMDLFGGGGCLDVEGYFDSICACQGDGVGEVATDEDGFADQAADFASEAEEGGGYAYEYGGGCHGDQIQTHKRSTEEAAAETQFDYCKWFQCGDIPPEQPPSSLGVLYNVSALHPQEQSQCMLESCGGNQNSTPFEGVAQSFSVPFPISEQRPIQTPPHEDDWFFTDILKDRRLLEC